MRQEINLFFATTYRGNYRNFFTVTAGLAYRRHLAIYRGNTTVLSPLPCHSLLQGTNDLDAMCLRIITDYLAVMLQYYLVYFFIIVSL